MPRSKKSSSREGTVGIGDVTLNDFANIQLFGKSRIRKSVSMPTSSVIAIEGLSLLEEPIEEDDTDQTFSNNKKRLRKKTVSELSENVNARTYPLDIWYIISDYIRPEDVGRFSAICRNSNGVVNRAEFWLRLYKRYYIPVKGMPEQLEPENVIRPYALKARVIRALYYMYPPFMSRCCINENSSVIRVHPSKLLESRMTYLLKRKCVSMWSQPKSEEGSSWKINFILKREDSSTKVLPKQDIMTLLEDIKANQQENCLFLQIIIRHYMTIPTVLGHTLMSMSFERCELALTFSGSASSSFNAVRLLFNEVEAVYAHEWWSPHYPHSNTFAPNLVGYAMKIDVS